MLESATREGIVAESSKQVINRTSRLQLRRAPARQPPKQVLGWDAPHVARFVEICRGRGAVALVLAAVTLNEDAGDDDKKDGAEGAGEGDQDHEADGHVPT